MTEAEIDQLLRGQNTQKPLRSVFDNYLLPAAGGGIAATVSLANALANAQRRQTIIQVP